MNSKKRVAVFGSNSLKILLFFDMNSKNLDIDWKYISESVSIVWFEFWKNVCSIPEKGRKWLYCLIWSWKKFLRLFGISPLKMLVYSDMNSEVASIAW